MPRKAKTYLCPECLTYRSRGGFRTRNGQRSLLCTFCDPPRRNKNRAVRTEYGGHQYASKLEARFAAHLDDQVQWGIIKGWKPHPARLPLVVNGVKIGVYTPDFVVYEQGGTQYYVDTKGRITSEWRFREKIIRACHPNMDLRIVQGKDF